MTLEEMLTALGNINWHGDHCEAFVPLRLNSFEANAIAAALRAGQALNNKAKEAIKDLEDDYDTCGHIVDMKNLANAWEAATKEDV